MNAPAPMREAATRLKAWLFDVALPLWWERGADLAGGYHDRLKLDGNAAPGLKRLRVQARQAHVYALAASLGWRGPAEAASRHGLAGVLSQKRDDGLFGDGPGPETPPDGMGRLYDQAFVLLALASDLTAFGDRGQEAEALALAKRLASVAERQGGFREASGEPEPLFANPNMHLFESLQAWSRAGRDPSWRALAENLARLAMDRLIDSETGVLLERYDAGWRQPSATAQRVVWPGHLYEWAWLLMDWPDGGAASLPVALRLIEIAERCGVDPPRGVVVFALDGDLASIDLGARLWAQTERLRACARAASLTGEAALWSAAQEACRVLEAFLATPTPGLWRDWMDEAGAFREEAAPASSLYHIAGAIAELDRLASG